ncbi:MAG: polysaccharide deacetylase family protein [candidate division WOR-3 bacterium]
MIGLLGTDPVWCSLLVQEGVPFLTKALEQSDGAAVLIIDRVPEGPELSAVRRFVASGGSVLAWAGIGSRVWPELTTRRVRAGHIFPDQSSLFRNVGGVDLAGSLLVPTGANYGLLRGGRPAVFAGRFGSGHAVLLPFDPAKVLAGRGSAPRVFSTRFSRPVFETVARVSRGEVRRLVANGLRFLLGARGLPYVRLSYVPGGHASAFCFRVDTDFCSSQAIHDVAEVGSRLGLTLSWFVNTGAAEGELSRLVAGPLREHDIQLHCYRHRVYHDYGRNRADIAKGVELLQAAGVRPVGIAAPYGDWNESWNRAAADAGLQYSSEFSIGYDDVPFRPVVSGNPSSLLQVPIHPVCFGRLVAARARPESIIAYFEQVIGIQVTRLEPCILYDHPSVLERFADQFETVAACGLRECGVGITMTEYARWWVKREKTRLWVGVRGRELELETDLDDADTYLVAFREDQMAIVPLRNERIGLDRLEWRTHPLMSDRTIEWRAPDARVRLQEILRRRFRRC